MMKSLNLPIAMLALAAAAAAQDPPAYLVRNATIHTLAGETIEGGSVLMQNGFITGVGHNVSAPPSTEVIDAHGKHLYPGMFDAYGRIGLVEINAVSATLDLFEEGDFHPQLQSLIAVHPDSEHIPVTRANGITHALTAMGGGVISGQAALIHLDGWTYEEMALQPSGPLVMQWPQIVVYEPDPEEPSESEPERPTTFTRAKQIYEERVAEIADWLEAANHYAIAQEAGLPPEDIDSKLAALVPYVVGQRPVIIVAQRERTIRNAVEFAAEHGLRMILAGAAEAWKVKELLLEKDIPVILGATQSLPLEEDDPYDRILTQPGELFEAGVLFAFGTAAGNPSSPGISSRTLPYEAASAVPFGLPHDEALKAVTVNPAIIFDVSDKVGTIEEGKVANLILVDGDPLEVTTKVERIFIQGREVSTDNPHEQLYKRYLNRP